MYLKRLELQGFKSFAPRTSLEFSPGITAIVGPNGSGKCLLGSSLVTLADGREVPIRDLVDDALLTASAREVLDDGLLTRENPRRVHVHSLDPVTLRIGARPVAAFVRREAPSHLLRIRTRSGCDVTATPYHPLFTLDHGQLRALNAEDLHVGRRIALPRRLPMAGREIALAGFESLAHLTAEDVIPGAVTLIDEAVQFAGVRVNRRHATYADDAVRVAGRLEVSSRAVLEVVRQMECAQEQPSLARAHLDRLATLATSDVWWDQIAAIERVAPPDPWVYDLSVNETHNFIAQHVIVHNSNIADAIRWVLGEQSMRQLRGKRSDDIIFAGGQSRAPMQMAEVGLVLDNSASWLPSEHTEVSAARRSFRSGESEYLVNGQRVRLRDLLLLLAQARIGHDSYTVIGQGLVDQALSLRAEERRGLFEDAAGIRQFQAQRTDAEQKLTLTQGNLARLHDILGEIEPRLGPLAEQARRAREYAGSREELKRQLRVWYAWQWQESQANQARADAAEAELGQRIEGIRAAMAAEEARGQQTRATRDALVSHLVELRRARGETTGRVQALERDLAVSQERRASLERQSADLAGEQGQQEESLTAAQTHVAALEQELGVAEEQAQSLAGQLDMLERSQHTARQEQEREEARLRAAQRDVIQAQTRLGAAQTELGRLQRQLGERNRALAARRDAEAAATRRAEAARVALEDQRIAFEAARARVEDLVGQRDALSREMAAGQAEVERMRAAVADAQRERRAVEDRLSLLEEWRRGLGGYADGVRAVLQAPAEEQPPVAGVVAQLVRASAGYELAIEGALGPFLQALVVGTFDEALACAGWLNQRGAGHALLVWPPEGGTAEESGSRGAPPSGADVLGPATAFVETQPALRPLLARLLNDAYVVRNLEVARRIQTEAGWSDGSDDGTRLAHAARLVTLAGEVLHRDGWLHGGGATAGPVGTATSPGVQASTLLARERELRQLPAELDRWTAEIAELEARHARAADVQQERQAQHRALVHALEAAEAQAQDLARQVAALQRDEERAQSEQLLSHAVAEQLAAETAGVEQEVAATAARVSEQESAQQEALDHMRDVQEAVDELVERHRAQQEELARQRTTLAVKRQEAKALGQRADQVRAQAHELALQIDRRAERVQSLVTQRAELEQEATEKQEALLEQRGRLRELAVTLQEQEGALAAAERELAQIDRDQALARQELAGLEVEYRRRMVEAQRTRDAVETLTAQLREEMRELGEQDETGEPTTAQTLLELVGSDSGSESQTITLTVEEAQRLRRQIDHLRGRLRQLGGGYDADAPQAYEELKTRHDFLSGQVRDMEQAATNLRTVIAELDTTMRRQFAETFNVVNQRFQRHFTTLFSGGSARLELTAPRRRPADDEDDDEGPSQAAEPRSAGLGGIEVFVQIPGKRVQDLALLSGGERAMVSAALLFALLETNPPPFCLLDEVDAALDEANVVRFCDILKVLAEQTQFVVITHNRVTMTHAGAIYGVSMGSDSVSRVLSMRLEQVSIAR